MTPVSPTPAPSDPAGDPRRWTLAAAWGAALLAAALVAGQIQLSMIDHGHDLWRLFLWQLSGWGFGALTAPWILASGSRLLRPAERPRGWPLRELAKAALLILLHLPLVAGVFTLVQPYVPVATYTFWQGFERALRSWLHVDFLAYGMVLAVGYGLAGYREARRSELQRSRLETELARAQLESLRLQLQPHFLFNTLHSIAALVRRRRNDRALDMVLGLSDLLRTTLERSDAPTVPLREEIELVRLYVGLQRARFGDRLAVAYEVPHDCLEQPVPTLFLQPLVENAIRHGIARRAAPGRIEIAARVDGGELVVTVADDGVGLPEAAGPPPDGVGLSNVRSRLRQLYGDGARLELRGRPGGGVTATVALPAEPSPGPALRAAG